MSDEPESLQLENDAVEYLDLISWEFDREVHRAAYRMAGDADGLVTLEIAQQAATVVCESRADFLQTLKCRCQRCGTEFELLMTVAIRDAGRVFCQHCGYTMRKTEASKR